MSHCEIIHFCEALKMYRGTSEDSIKLHELADRVTDHFGVDTQSIDELIEYTTSIVEVDSTKMRKERRKERNRVRKIITNIAEELIQQETILGDSDENNLEFPELNDQIDRLLKDD